MCPYRTKPIPELSMNNKILQALYFCQLKALTDSGMQEPVCDLWADFLQELFIDVALDARKE